MGSALEKGKSGCSAGRGSRFTRHDPIRLPYRTWPSGHIARDPGRIALAQEFSVGRPGVGRGAAGEQMVLRVIAPAQCARGACRAQPVAVGIVCIGRYGVAVLAHLRKPPGRPE